ncbi:hypothetical protein [Labrenzia sp. OB1]|uniref:hypothetical protein n=1 Tax=Labrenzia sp. OB1 TaxID=1561204 RepID=UPI0012E96927|nr:hypothetical protein [Labrenzia sp. OB1]
MSDLSLANRQLQNILLRDDLPDTAKAELEAMQKELNSPLQTDRWIYRTVVVVLGTVVIVTVFGGIYLEIVSNGDEKIGLPQAIVSIGSAAIGALAGLLAPSPSS